LYFIGSSDENRRFEMSLRNNGLSIEVLYWRIHEGLCGMPVRMSNPFAACQVQSISKRSIPVSL